MTEAVSSDGSSVPKAAFSRRQSAKPTTVSPVGTGTASWSVIQRQGDGFPLDPSRVAYLRYLRRERQQSPRAAGMQSVLWRRRHCYASGSGRSSASWCDRTMSMN